MEREDLARMEGEQRFLLAAESAYIGLSIDLTDRKLAGDALAALRRKVINAQEQESSRIARELHDDINQRIALVISRLESLSRMGPGTGLSLQSGAKTAVDQLRSVANDIRAISRRSHISHLEYLGLAKAAGALCREVSAQHHVEIDFKCDPGFPHLHKDVSLSLYRVLQEALQNAIKHSGARIFAVNLAGSATEVRLSVSDRGVGFDLEKTDQKQGLGIISMRERMQLVHGEFAVESKQGRGTTIRCRIGIRAGSPTEPLEN